jgi:hypothetical protein
VTDGTLEPEAPPQPGASRLKPLAEVVTDASALLYHAVANGKSVAAAVREPIITARAAVVAGEPVSPADESAFLEAYSRLAVLVAPVTAATLRATSRHQNPRSPLARLLRLRSASHAQIASFRFGLLALCLLLMIGAGEWTRTFVTTIIAGQDELAKVREEHRGGTLQLRALEDQIKALETDPARGGGAPATVRASLIRQREELAARLDRLREQRLGLEERIRHGYATLNRFVPFVDWAELRNVILPIANIIGGFFLPVLYGALGTCAYILRTIYSQMCERSFDARQNGEFIVRIFLGMLSGITLQWIFVRDGSSVPGGITPAVLAFIGGYSVEVLFTAMDRLLTALTGSLRTTAGPTRSASTPPAAEPPGAGT